MAVRAVEFQRGVRQASRAWVVRRAGHCSLPRVDCREKVHFHYLWVRVVWRGVRCSPHTAAEM